MLREARGKGRSLLGLPGESPGTKQAPLTVAVSQQQGLCKVNPDGTATLALVSSPACSVDRKSLGIIQATPPTIAAGSGGRKRKTRGESLSTGQSSTNFAGVEPPARKAAASSYPSSSSSDSDEDTSRLLFPDAGAITDSDETIGSRATEFLNAMTRMILHHKRHNTTIPGISGNLNRLVPHDHLSPKGQVHLPANLTTNRINYIEVRKDDVAFSWPPYLGRNHDSGNSPSGDWEYRKVTIPVAFLRGALVNAEGVPLFPTE